MTFTRAGVRQLRFQYVGSTDGGPPVAADGPFAAGMWVDAPDGLYICSQGGTPGTWVQLPGAPGIKVITAVTDAFTPTARVLKANNTSGSSKTFTSTPTVADGYDGQHLTIVNISASDVVLSDQGTLANSGLRLGAATRTLSTRDSIELVYSADIGDWCELAFANVT